MGRGRDLEHEFDALKAAFDKLVAQFENTEALLTERVEILEDHVHALVQEDTNGEGGLTGYENRSTIPPELIQHLPDKKSGQRELFAEAQLKPVGKEIG